jgi:hypothetical protein
MLLKVRCSNLSVGIVKKIILSHQRLFDEVLQADLPERQAILDQMIHGNPQHKSIKLYHYLLGSFLLAGGGDQSNYSYYAKQRVKPTFNRVKEAVKAAQCPKLATFEAFTGCGYQKTKSTCREPTFLGSCPVPAFDMKRGPLNQMAFSLYFFLRDVCGGDFYSEVSQHFGQGWLTDGEISDRLQSFIQKVTRIANVGPKLAYMALSGLFLTHYPGWDYRRVGLHMIAVDSLVHNFLHRTGILGFYQLDHAYGPRCHTEKGCLGVIQDLASRIDCREFNPTLPACFPRFVQYHIWAFCGKNGENICNGNKCKPGKPNPECVLYHQQWCAQLPPKSKQPMDPFLFP